MINKCKNLRIRQKKYIKYFYCLSKRHIISLDDCKNCSKPNLVANKPIKKASKNRITVKKEIYQKVYDRDKGKCRLCGTTKNLQLHHIVYRSEDKKLINEPTNCIMLCTKHHQEVHSNKHKWQPILKEMNNNEYNSNMEKL